MVHVRRCTCADSPAKGTALAFVGTKAMHGGKVYRRAVLLTGLQPHSTGNFTSVPCVNYHSHFSDQAMDTTLLEGSQFEGITVPLGGESPWQAGDRKIHWVARAPYPVTSQFSSKQ